MYQFVREHDLGIVLDAPFDAVLGKRGEERVVQPGILFVSKGPRGIIREEEICRAPDIVVEVLSPATAQRDRAYKRTLYARHGVKGVLARRPRDEDY